MLTNRLDPEGRFVTTPHRGGFMGNRGRLHDDQGNIRRRWAGKAWITCTLRDKPGRPNPGVLPPHGYTRLFFADEAVACAAGHRPCAECRRAVYRAFRAAWEAAHGPVATVRDIDAALHAARRGGPWRAKVGDLPDGTFILWDGVPARVSGDGCIPYVSGSYGSIFARPSSMAPVLTPAPMVAVLRQGWRPALHPGDDRPNW